MMPDHFLRTPVQRERQRAKSFESPLKVPSAVDDANRFPSLSGVELGHKVRRAVMLSMMFTQSAEPPVVFNHPGGSAGRYTHEDYDAAMSALNELVRRAESA